MKGKTEARLYTKPLRKLTEKTTLGYACIEYAKNVLHKELYPWQEWCLIHALEITGSLAKEWKFRYRIILIEVSRQNGKTVLSEVLASFFLNVLEIESLFGTSLSLDKAEEVWEAVINDQESIPELSKDIDRISRTNGNKRLVLKGLRQYKVGAPTRRAGRGDSNDLVMLDELREHRDWETWSAAAGSTVAKPNGLIVCFSNAGDPDSIVLRQIRNQALGKEADALGGELGDESLGLFEWSAPDGAETNDLKALAQANPALGYGYLTERALMSNRATFPRRINSDLNVCVSKSKRYFLNHSPDGKWDEGLDVTSEIEASAELFFGIDMSLDRKWVSIGVCGLREDGNYHIELVARRIGTDWAIDWFRERAVKGKMNLAFQGRGAPVCFLAEQICTIDGINRMSIEGTDLSDGWGRFYDGIANNKIYHLEQPLLDAAAKTMQMRNLGGGIELPDRKKSPNDIAPLYCCIMAHTACTRMSVGSKKVYESSYASGGGVDVCMNYVLPFVDCNDPVWIEQYQSAFAFPNSLKQTDKSRFRPFNTLKYAFRSVAVNMPFIDRIVLIVSTESQVPEWVNRETVRVVTHDEFMPKNHLPTFNSSAIESDMWRIDGLSDRFIYGNDDFFVMNPMNESDFFDGNIPRLNFEQSDYSVRNIFRMCCRHGMDMAAEAVGVPYSDSRVLLKPQHCMKGIRTESMKEVGRKCADKIESTISMTRHWSNITGYLYHYYEYYQGNYRPFEKKYGYIRINNDYQDVIDAIRDRSIDMLCINDAGDLDDEYYSEACEALTEAFEERFPNESKFEIFRIIIPTYNGAEFLPRMVNTIKEQSCQDYHLIIVDDMSTDGITPKVIKDLKPHKIITMERKGYAAGARNEGMKHFTGDRYTLWFDDDDILIDADALAKLKQCAIDNDYPDIIRFNFIKTALSTKMRGKHHDRYPDPITPEEICKEIQWGMPWTKAVKSELCVEFPEELSVDDCFQHIMQCDVCETAAVVHDDLYEWLVRENSTTTSAVHVRRDSGWYLEIGMLMRKAEQMKHVWAREACEMRINWIKQRYLRR